ncbi:choline kinase family protein [Nostoc sp.]|uniref:choline kinase family protein n=1 Tax=Nostoc sp. TaxID=1180 RepID=UPI002FF900FF
MKQSIDKIIANLPIWEGQGDLKIVPIGDQNFTNQNYRVESNGQVFKVRISEGNQDLIGIAREEELVVLKAVARAGIGPEVIAYIPPEGHLVTRFIEGKHLSLEEMTKPDNIRRITQVLRQVHAIEGIEAAPPPFERIEALLSNARREKGLFPNDFEKLLADLQCAKAVLTKAWRKPCLCHNDLAGSNILDANGSIYLIDWEYAGKADPMFDLANFSMNQNLDREGDKILIESYFEKVTEVELAEINLWKMVAIFIEGIWGILQARISRLDRDYQGFANENWKVVRHYTQSESFSEWLAIVSS